MAASSAHKGVEVPKTVSQAPSASTHGSSAVTDRPATPSNSKQVAQKFSSWLRGPFSRSKRRTAQPTPAGIEIAQDQNPQVTSITTQDMILVRAESIHIKENTVDPARKVVAHDLAIAAIDIFQSIVECTDSVVPNPVRMMLGQLTKVLRVLKRMVEGKEAWKLLLLTLDGHAAQFDKQLVRMNQAKTKPGADSSVLAPLKDYSTALEKLTAEIIMENGLVRENSIGEAGWDKIKRFTTKYIGVESETSQIETYRQELRGAMQMLSHDLGIYVAFTVGHISSNTAAYGLHRRNFVAKRPPEVSPHYVARDKEWSFLIYNLVDSTVPGRKSLSITGMEGCGKTQLVSYFLKEKKDLFTYVVYVDASSKVSIEADLRAWARSLGDGHEQDEWDNALHFLTDDRWAYILDNADDPELDLSPFLPTALGDGTIIITSRNRKLRNLTHHHLSMGEMTEEEALSVLVNAARRRSSIPAEELKSARTLAKELGCLALALAHAGAYCHHLSSDDGNVFTFTQYLLNFFHSHRAALMKQPGPPAADGYKMGVYTTLDLSYEKLPQPSREFLRFISNFHYFNIPMEMITAAVETRFEDPKILLPRPDGHEASFSRLTTLLGTDRTESEFRTEVVVSTLRSFSLVSTTFIEGSLFLQLHPLVQAWARDMKSSDVEDYGIMATRVLTSCANKSNMNIYRHLLPHIIEKLNDNRGLNLHANDQIALGHVLLKMGRYSAAENLFREAHKSLWIIHKEDTENTIWVTGCLAETYAGQGRYDDAERLELEVLEKRRKILGAENLDTILTAANLAATYSSQGRYNEAKELELEVLEKRRKILGTNHPDTIRAATNLAATYHFQGRHAEAERLELEVLEKRTKILGAKHPETIGAAGSLAATYHFQGRYTEAEKLELEVLEKRVTILGDEHPETIGAAANLAATYCFQGRYTEAEELELEVLKKRREILGTDHPDTIRAATNLEATYRFQGRHAEAERLELEVLEKRTKILGAELPKIVGEADILAATYHFQGRYLVSSTRSPSIRRSNSSTARPTNLHRTIYSSNITDSTQQTPQLVVSPMNSAPMSTLQFPAAAGRAKQQTQTFPASGYHHVKTKQYEAPWVYGSLDEIVTADEQREPRLGLETASPAAENEQNDSMVDHQQSWQMSVPGDSHGMHTASISRSAGLTQIQSPGPVGLFRNHLVKPLMSFLTIPYLRAKRILHLARTVNTFHMQSIYLSRQALHLVILLNDVVDTVEGPDDEQYEERNDLADELIELADAMRDWGTNSWGEAIDYKQQVLEIKQWHIRLFRERFYFHDVRDSATDLIYPKLLAYDERTIRFRKWREEGDPSRAGINTSHPSIRSESRGVGVLERHTGTFITSGGSSPASDPVEETISSSARTSSTIASSHILPPSNPFRSSPEDAYVEAVFREFSVPRPSTTNLNRPDNVYESGEVRKVPSRTDAVAGSGVLHSGLD